LIAMRGLFNRYVQIGRIAVVSYGTDYGKLCTIVDVIDHNRVLIDGPETITGIRRQQYNLKRLALTGLRVKIPKGCRLGLLAKAFKDNKILDKWKKTSWAKKINARHSKDNSTDFQRFVVMLAKGKKNRVVTKTVKQLIRNKKKIIKNKKEAFKLKKEGKPLPKKLEKLTKPITRTKKEVPKTKSGKVIVKRHGRSFLARIRAQKLNKALDKKATAAHERNVKNKKRKAEKAKLGDKKSEKPKEKPAKRQKTKKTKETPKETPKEAPKAKATPKATVKATPKTKSKK